MMATAPRSHAKLISMLAAIAVATALAAKLRQVEFIIAFGSAGLVIVVEAAVGVAIAKRMGMAVLRTKSMLAIATVVILAKALVGIGASSWGEVVGYTAIRGTYVPTEPWYGLGMAAMFLVDSSLLAWVARRVGGRSSVPAYGALIAVGVATPSIGYIRPELWSLSIVLWVAGTAGVLTLLASDGSRAQAAFQA